MPDRSFTVDIVTPERVVVSDQAVSLVAPGVEGSFGVLVNHAPMLAELKPGELLYRKESGEQVILAVGGGFLQVFENQVTILADSAERPEEIDADRARLALERAREAMLRAQGTYSAEAIAEAERAYERARNRIRMASR